MKKFEKKVVFITGASSGIGAALAKGFSKLGADLVLTARREERLKVLASELSRNGHRAVAVKCDVTQEGDLEKAVHTSVEEYGKIDIVIANAGFGVVGDFEKLKLEDYRRQFETNIFGVLRTIYASLEELKKTKGTLVLIGSVAGYIALPGSSPYSMSKFAIHALAHSITDELSRYGISVVLIAPGFVESEIQQIDNRGRYHDQAASPPPKWLTMPAPEAARKIISAIAAKRREQVITTHGKVAVLIRRHFPWVWTQIARRGITARPEPSRKSLGTPLK